MKWILTIILFAIWGFTAKGQENTFTNSAKIDLNSEIHLVDPKYLKTGSTEIKSSAPLKNSINSFPYFEPTKPIYSYKFDFDSESSDFVTKDFDISMQEGFISSILHTCHPYPVSKIEDEKYNLFAILKTPIIIQENGTMSYKEVLLIEPGQIADANTCQLFWDYVVVEGSKDNGDTWLPIVDKYDSQIQIEWKTLFNNSLLNGSSIAKAEESMFSERIINLTENGNFIAGDTVLICFRLASDMSINGWGWAIDDLKIQQFYTKNIEEIIIERNKIVYPNPFNNKIILNFSSFFGIQEVKVTITDLYGKTVFMNSFSASSYVQQEMIMLDHLSSGIYFLNITGEDKKIESIKIIKN